MDRFTDTSINPFPVVNPSYKGGNDENELNPDMVYKLKSPNKKQLLIKNFMGPTKSAAIKAASPKRKILAERNEIETLGVVRQQPGLVRSTSFGSKAVKFDVVDAINDDDCVKKDVVSKPCLEPYDPIKNYLSPRPKYLRYNPNRRRKILDFQENDVESVKSSVLPSFGLGLELDSDSDSSGYTDSCSEQESLKEVDDVSNCEDDESDESDGEEDEFEGDDESRKWDFKGFFKVLVVVIALIFTTQAICSMKSPKHTNTLELIQSYNSRYTNVHGLGSANFSEIVNDSMKEVDLVVERFKEEEVCNDDNGLDMVETIEELIVMQDEEDKDEVVNDETNFIQDEMWINQDDIFKTENVLEEIDDIETTNQDEITNTMATFDPTLAVIIGLVVIIVTSLGAIYRTKQTKPAFRVLTSVVEENKLAEKEEIKILEPNSNQPSMDGPTLKVDSAFVQKDVYEETSHINAPSVELLGEFVFGNDVSNASAEAKASNCLIQSTAYSFSQTKSTYMEKSTGDSHTVKKQRRKSTEASSMVTPSPVRRSSRLQKRSIMSP